MNTRLLGSILIVASLIAMLEALRQRAPETGDTLSRIVFILWCIGGIAGVVGLIRLNALGTNATMRAAAFLPIIGFVAGILGDGLNLIGGETAQPVTSAILGFAWITILGGMLVVGILTIAAKSWQGWRRFVPLLTVVSAPVSLAIGAAIGSVEIGGALAFSFWVLLGFVIATAELPQPVPQAMTA